MPLPTEFEFIQNIKRKYGLNRVGDDCAVLPKDGKTDLVVTADMLVEGIDFRLDWTTAEFLGHKSLAVSLSDIAAMGAEPDWAMLTIGIPERLWAGQFLDEFYTSWNKLGAAYRVELVGGDISRVPDNLVIDSIVAGSVKKGKAIYRTGAQPGDKIYVTGRLGGAAAGLELLSQGERPSGVRNDSLDLLLKQLRPYPRLDAAAKLQQGSLATAMIDLSDGLSSDLDHLIRASRVGARLFLSDIPIEAASSSYNALACALHGGEDLELLFTSSSNIDADGDLSDFFQIGEITANESVIELVVGNDTQVLIPAGYRHF